MYLEIITTIHIHKCPYNCVLKMFNALIHLGIIHHKKEYNFLLMFAQVQLEEINVNTQYEYF